MVVEQEEAATAAIGTADESSVDWERDWDDDSDAVVMTVALAVAVAADERTNFLLFDLATFSWIDAVASFLF